VWHAHGARCSAACKVSSNDATAAPASRPRPWSHDREIAPTPGRLRSRTRASWRGSRPLPADAGIHRSTRIAGADHVGVAERSDPSRSPACRRRPRHRCLHGRLHGDQRKYRQGGLGDGSKGAGPELRCGSRGRGRGTGTVRARERQCVAVSQGRPSLAGRDAGGGKILRACSPLPTPVVLAGYREWSEISRTAVILPRFVRSRASSSHPQHGHDHPHGEHGGAEEPK